MMLGSGWMVRNQALMGETPLAGSDELFVQVNSFPREEIGRAHV